MNSEVRISNIRFDRVTTAEALTIIKAFALQRFHPKYVCTGNLDHLRLASLDPEFAEAYEEADLVLADGMPIVWLSRLAGKPLPERVTGSDITRLIGKISSETKCRIFLLGGEPGSAEKAGKVIKEMYPSSNIVGHYCPPHESFETEKEQKKIKFLVRTNSPDILLVALGAPKQEKWIRANLLSLDVPVTIGVGGSFEMLSGARSRAPLFVQKVGMEWCWRLCQEPKRLFRRYIVDGIPFLGKVFLRTAVKF